MASLPLITKLRHSSHVLVIFFILGISLWNSAYALVFEEGVGSSNLEQKDQGRLDTSLVTTSDPSRMDDKIKPLESMSPLEWPWHHSNDTSNACNTHANCTSCNEASVACHWCSKDNECHAKGSWYGCSVGDSCPSNDTSDNSCKSHLDCTECALSSSLCHWCAFDEECHAIGSFYGCAHGVNCYSNDRCKRDEPEPVEESMFEDIGFIPLVLIISVTMSVVCCSSFLYAGASALKGAYEDLAEVRSPPSEIFSDQYQFQPLDSNREEESERNVDTGEDCEEENIHNDSCENTDQRTEEVSLDLGGNHDDDEDAPNQETSNEPMLTEHLVPVTAYPDPTRLPSVARPSRHMNCLMRSCRVWYFLTIIGALLIATASVVFFPRAPVYNVCSDEFAWKSIIAGLTSLKMEASFEILMSVENKNALDIALEGFGGKFKHSGDEVGTFTMKRTVIHAKSITDVMVTCTVSPDKWDTLGLISDYYKGTLLVFVDANGTVKVHGFGFSFPIKISDYSVKVNDPDMKDRHLCACPEWKDTHIASTPSLPFQLDVVDKVEFAIPFQKDLEVAVE